MTQRDQSIWEKRFVQDKTVTEVSIELASVMLSRISPTSSLKPEGFKHREDYCSRRWNRGYNEHSPHPPAFDPGGAAG